MDTHAWLDSYRRRIDDLEARAATAQRELAAVQATAHSADHAVSVTVNPTGALIGLVLSERSERLTRTQLAAAVLEAARAAQAAAARRSAAAVAPLIGSDSAAMRTVTGYLPDPEADGPGSAPARADGGFATRGGAPR